MSNRSPKLEPAYYTAAIEDFLRADPDAIYGKLGRYHAHAQELAQKLAWLDQIKLLQRNLSSIPKAWISFEFAIPRMGKRADAVLILDGIIFVIEFKVGAETFTSSALEQVTDYALDLKNFHVGSHERIIVPVVIATDAISKPVQLNLWPDDVAEPILSNGIDLDRLLVSVALRFSGQPVIDPEKWISSGYKPTPTIIEAAQALYRSHQVEDITRSDAGAKNLTVTTQRITEIVEDAKAQHQKVICFVTGVPGAGKTLAGLNLVTSRAEAHKDEHAVFLSGNGPLVDVLREALARDKYKQGAEVGCPITMGNARREVRSFIQNIHHFRDANLLSHDAPSEHLAVFDEAQRAWNQGKIRKFMREKHGFREFEQSEPEFLIGVMDRHADWAVIVCLIGGGQEINDGEAGLSEWFIALSKKYSHWKIFSSTQLAHADYHWGYDLAGLVSSSEFRSDGDLHLAVSVRSFRAEKLSQFINEVVFGNAPLAREIYRDIERCYPIVVTRSLDSARVWLRGRARGSERYGLVASSGASRLKPEGINVHAEISAPTWFLSPRTDVRSSYYLEDPATEFDIQGLELDWIGVCWDGDFRREAGAWVHKDFQGSRWKNVNDDRRKKYLANAYRVLLTRARQGMVIYVPPGDTLDPTRSPTIYDETAGYLRDCGITDIT